MKSKVYPEVTRTFPKSRALQSKKQTNYFMQKVDTSVRCMILDFESDVKVPFVAILTDEYHAPSE